MPDEQNSPETSESTRLSDGNQTLAEVKKTANQPYATSQLTLKSHKKKLSLTVLAVIGLSILAAGSAGAYYGIIAPNKPENVLKAAFRNSLEQKKTKFTGKFSFENTEESASLKAVNVTIDGQVDLEKGDFQAVTEVTASGVKVPFEIRGVDKNVYVKVSDLSSLKNLVKVASPAIAPLFDQVNEKIADKWIEIDETLLKQAGSGCAASLNYSFTKQDIDLLINRYQAVPFATVKSSNDSVDGKAAIKYDIEIDDNKGAEYAKGLGELSLVKKLKECTNGKPLGAKSLADNDKTPLTLWINKSSKQIVKLAGHTTAQDEQQDRTKGSFEVSLQYGKAAISKPDGAVPLLQIVAELGSLFSGSPIAQTLGL